MRGEFIYQKLQCTPPSAQKKPSAVPGDIPELTPRMKKIHLWINLDLPQSQLNRLV